MGRITILDHLVDMIEVAFIETDQTDRDIARVKGELPHASIRTTDLRANVNLVVSQIERNNPTTLTDLEALFPNQRVHRYLGDRWKGWIRIDPVPNNPFAHGSVRIHVKWRGQHWEFRVVKHD